MNVAAARNLVLAAPAPSHAVQFYENEEFLGAAVADFLEAGLTIGQPPVVIASEPHHDVVDRRLADRGIDLDAARKRGQLTSLDARDTLASIVVDGAPNAERFRTTLTNLFEPIVRDNGHAGLRVYGGMVDLLWKDGDTDGAIHLEELWNELGRSFSFSLLCAYAMGNF